MSKLMSGLEFIQVHIDNLLILTKESYKDHLNKLEQKFKWLLEVGLKVNAKKSRKHRVRIRRLQVRISQSSGTLQCRVPLDCLFFILG